MKKLRFIGLSLPAVGLLLLAGCGKSTVGMVCGSTDECDKGLTCLQQNSFDFTANKCVTGDRMCSAQCQTDADCTGALGAGHICVGGTSGNTTATCPPGMCFEGSHN